MVVNKIRSDFSFLSLGTGDSVTPEKRIPRKRNNMKSFEMSPPRKYPIQNQYINRLSTKKYQSLPAKLAKYPPGYKSLINEAEYDRNGSTDRLITDKEDYVKNMKAINKNILTTNKNMRIHKIITVMKVLSTKLK